MPSCYDRTSCSVNPDNGALTVNTKHGSCTVVPGDFVTLTESDGCYTITVVDQAQVPNVSTVTICPGDDVSFTEDEDCYIITINNEPHCIPKCRYYRDCEGNILDDCARIVTCDDLAQRGFISCVDEDDFQLTTECEDGSCVNCIAIKWDQICAEAETVDEIPENGNVLFCANGVVQKSNFQDNVVDIIDNYCFDPNDVGETCGDISYAVWQNCPDGQGYTLGRYSSSTASSFIVRGSNIPYREPNQTYTWPTDPIFQSNGGPYTSAEIRQLDDFDGSGSNGQINDHLDEMRFRNNVVGYGEIDLDCPTLFSFDTTMLIATGTFASVQEAFDARTNIYIRYRVDGGEWVWPRNSADNTLQLAAAFNGITTTALTNAITGTQRFPAGHVEVELVVSPSNDVSTAAAVAANTWPAGYGLGHPSRRFMQAFS